MKRTIGLILLMIFFIGCGKVLQSGSGKFIHDSGGAELEGIEVFQGCLYKGGKLGIQKLCEGSWEVSAKAEEIKYINSLKSYKGNLYAGIDMGIYRTSDGEVWEHVAEHDEVGKINDFFILGDYLYAGGTKGLSRSSNGKNWQFIMELSELSDQTSGYIFTFEKFKGNIHMGGKLDGIFRSADGENWEITASNLNSPSNTIKVT